MSALASSVRPSALLKGEAPNQQEDLSPCDARSGSVKLQGSSRVDHYKAGFTLSNIDPDGCHRKVLTGWACTSRRLGQRDRVIFDFLLPGDIVNVHPRHTPFPPDYSIVALTALSVQPVRLADTQADSDIASFFPKVGVLMPHEDRLLRNNILRLSRLSARQRLAHLVLEIHDRLGRNGTAHGANFLLPIKKDDLSNYLGITVQHLSRSLGDLEKSNALRLRAGRAEILCRQKLEEEACYPAKERSWPAAPTATHVDQLAPAPC